MDRYISAKLRPKFFTLFIHDVREKFIHAKVEQFTIDCFSMIIILSSEEIAIVITK